MSPLKYKAACYGVALMFFAVEVALRAPLAIIFGHAAVNILIAEFLIDTGKRKDTTNDQ